MPDIVATPAGLAGLMQVAMATRNASEDAVEDWRPRIAGRLVLVVEDELLIACWIEEVLNRLGGTAVLAANERTALDAIARRPLDAALLDFNLGGGRDSLPIADALEARGIPFGFITASDRRLAETRHAGRPLVPKPTFDEDLHALLRTLLPGA